MEFGYFQKNETNKNDLPPSFKDGDCVITLCDFLKDCEFDDPERSLSKWKVENNEPLFEIRFCEKLRGLSIEEKEKIVKHMLNAEINDSSVGDLLEKILYKNNLDFIDDNNVIIGMKPILGE